MKRPRKPYKTFALILLAGCFVHFVGDLCFSSHEQTFAVSQDASYSAHEDVPSPPATELRPNQDNNKSTMATASEEVASNYLASRDLHDVNVKTLLDKELLRNSANFLLAPPDRVILLRKILI